MNDAAPTATLLRVVRTLKTDLFGRVELCHAPGREDDLVVRRDTTRARRWTRPLAVRLARREARALSALEGVTGVPELRSWQGGVLVRSWIEGEPMQLARPADAAYYRRARRLIRRFHRLGVAHRDLAKEPNWLVTPGGEPAIVDYQLAAVRRNPGRRRPGRLFRLMAREDLRHLLKHKRTYRPDHLTATDRRILARRSWYSRLWMRTGKPIYLWITRGIFRWADREGAGDRQLKG